VGVIIEVRYASAGALKHDWETELAVGGLFLRVAPPPGLPPFAELTVFLRVPGEPALSARARLTVATAASMCVEIAPADRAALGAEVERRSAGIAAAPGRVDVRLTSDEAEAAAEAALAAEPVADAEAAPAAAPATPAAEAEGAPAAPATAAARAAREAARLPLARRIELMSVTEKMRLAMTGDRDARTLLARDRAGPVQCGLVRNPKLTLDEAQALARNPQLNGEAAEALLQHPTWGSSPQIAVSLVRNPRTPLPLAIGLIPRLPPAELRGIAKGLNVRTQVAQAARKRLFNT
jgi:hypothetical protein